MQTYNALMSLLAAAGLAWVVLHPRIHEGVVVKTGLVMMIFGLLAVAGLSSEQVTSARAWANAGLVFSTGVVVACVGAAIRMAPRRKGARHGV
jgi:hypothetical protein